MGMKNADRINFYMSGLRQPGTRSRAGTTNPSPTPETGPSAAASSATPATKSDSPATDGIKMAAEIIVPGSGAAPGSVAGDISFREALLTTEVGQQVLALDQAQLHRLLQRLDYGRQSSGDKELLPEVVRKKQRQLILGLMLAGLIIALQATAVFWLYHRAELLLGRPLSPSLLLTASAGDLTVTFRPSASAGDVAVLLRELDLHVVDGPDTGSRYVLRPEIGSDGARMLNALRDRRDLVYSADPAY